MRGRVREALRRQLDKSVPNLWNKVLPPGVGHWTEQEAPAEVNRLIVEFLASLDEAS